MLVHRKLAGSSFVRWQPQRLLRLWSEWVSMSPGFSSALEFWICRFTDSRQTHFIENKGTGQAVSVTWPSVSRQGTNYFFFYAWNRHDRFRSMCMSLAQFMYRAEIKLRTNILGEKIAVQGRHIRPLSEAKSVTCFRSFLRRFYSLTTATQSNWKRCEPTCRGFSFCRCGWSHYWRNLAFFSKRREEKRRSWRSIGGFERTPNTIGGITGTSERGWQSPNGKVRINFSICLSVSGPYLFANT